MHGDDTQIVDAILSLVEETRSNLDRIEALLKPWDAIEGLDDLDPKNPLNKNGVNLTPRGVEVAYRMFDMGKTRYAVAQALDLSFGAATNRLYAWEKAGGKNREKQPLTIRESYDKKYGTDGADILSSKNKVAAAGRSEDETKIENERERHSRFIEELRIKKLGGKP